MLDRFGIFEYVFKPTPELMRTVGLAAVTMVLQVIRDTPADAFTSPQDWLIAVAVGVGHAALAYVLGKRPA